MSQTQLLQPHTMASHRMACKHHSGPCRAADRLHRASYLHRVPVFSTRRDQPGVSPRSHVVMRSFSFGFGKKPADMTLNVRQRREEFTREDVEDYFNYMGMLAVEGTYDKLHAMLDSGLDNLEILLLWACSENDLPKVEEVLGAGARVDVKNVDGKRPEELATKPEILELLQQAAAKQR